MNSVGNNLERELANYKLMIRKIEKTNRLPFLQLHVVDHCNLNCKSCAHFSPIADKWFADYSDLEKSYKLLQPYLERYFSRLELMGGEPLLHPQLESIISLTRAYFPNIDLRVVTNGILLPHMCYSFFETCAKNSISIYISKYPININYEKICEMLDAYGVEYHFYGDYNEDKLFIDYRLDPLGNNNGNKNYRYCKLGGRCLQLRNNKIYPCFIAAYSNVLNSKFGCQFVVEPEDSISIEELEDESRFIDFINMPIPFCKYCSLVQEKYVPWGTSQKSIYEWIIDSKGEQG